MFELSQSQVSRIITIGSEPRTEVRHDASNPEGSYRCHQLAHSIDCTPIAHAARCQIQSNNRKRKWLRTRSVDFPEKARNRAGTRGGSTVNGHLGSAGHVWHFPACIRCRAHDANIFVRWHDREPRLAFGLGGQGSVVREDGCRGIPSFQGGLGDVLGGRSTKSTERVTQGVVPPREQSSGLGGGVLGGGDAPRPFPPCLPVRPDRAALLGQRR